MFREKITKTGTIIRYLIYSAYRKGEIVSLIDYEQILDVDIKLPEGTKLLISNISCSSIYTHATDVIDL